MADPAWFWDGLLTFLDIRFYRPYEKVLDMSRGKAWTDWCVGGTTNAYLNCIETHRGTPAGKKPYIEWQGEDGRTRSLSYQNFDAEANRLAAARAAMALGRELADRHDLASLKVMITGGEPATPDAWGWVFEVIGGERLPIINVSGGTRDRLLHCNRRHHPTAQLTAHPWVRASPFSTTRVNR